MSLGRATSLDDVGGSNQAAPMPPFVCCPHCDCPVKSQDPACPSCGGFVRGTDGRVARAAVAVLLGLTAATGLGACASAPKYGVPATEGEPTATATTTTTDGAPTPSATTVAPPPDPGPEVRPLYGIPATQGDR